MFDIGGAFVGRGVDPAEHGHGDDRVVLLQTNAAHTGRIPALEDAHVVSLEADGAAQGGRQHDVVLGGAQGDADHVIAVLQLHGDLAGPVDRGEVAELVAAHVARAGGEHDVVVAPLGLVLGQGQDVHDRIARLDRQQVDEGLAARLRIAQRQPPGLQLVGLAVGGKEEHRRMGRGREDADDGIILLHRHAAAALAAAMLGPIGVQRHAFDVAAVGDSDDHVLARDQVLVFQLIVAFADQGPARHGELLAHLQQVRTDHRQDVGAIAEQGQVALDGVGQATRLAEDVVAAEAGQAAQRQAQDGAGLFVGQVQLVALDQHRARVGNQFDQGDHVADRPALGLQPLARLGRIDRAADDVDDLVDIGDSHGQTDQHVAAVAGLGQFELDAADDHFLAELEEGLQQLAQPHLDRAAVVQGQHVDAERALHGGETPQLVQHHIRRGVALQLDDHPHAVAVGFVADVRNALDPLLADHFDDAFDQGLFVDLEGQLGDHDGLTILADRLDRGLAAHDDRAAAIAQGVAGGGPAHDLAAGREVRAGHDVQQGVVADVRVVEQGDAGVDDLAQIMRRDVGRHADGDAAGAIDQQVRDPRRQDDGLQLLLVVVRLEIDRILVDVGQQGRGGRGHPRLGVTHRRRHIAVDRAEIALAVDQHQSHREGLGHAHQRHIDRGVAMRVEPAQHIAHDPRTLRIRPVRRHLQVVHRIQDAAVHGLQPVTRVRQGAGHDHAHGVVEIRAPQLVLDRDGGYVAAAGPRRGRKGVVVAVVSQGNQALNGRNRNVIRERVF